MFTRGSRYESVPDAEFVDSAGRVIRYKRVRLLPPVAEDGDTAVVEQGDRPDLLAWRVAQDPEGYWRLCDANDVRRPAELVARPGARIRLPRRGG